MSLFHWKSEIKQKQIAEYLGWIISLPLVYSTYIHVNLCHLFVLAPHVLTENNF